MLLLELIAQCARLQLLLRQKEGRDQKLSKFGRPFQGLARGYLPCEEYKLSFLCLAQAILSYTFRFARVRLGIDTADALFWHGAKTVIDSSPVPRHVAYAL